LLVDLELSVVQLPDGRTIAFSIEGFSRYCLLNGIDELGYLRSQDAAIGRYEQAHQARP